jgi:hypothetical protein
MTRPQQAIDIRMHYATKIPRKLPPGRVLVHNQVAPQRVLARDGFRAWTQDLTDDLQLCDCHWAGVDLHGLPHYRVKGLGKLATPPFE